jgi:hypothetical protein
MIPVQKSVKIRGQSSVILFKTADKKDMFYSHIAVDRAAVV